MSRNISIIALDGLPLVEPGDDITGLIIAALDAMNETLLDGDILVIAQKIISKAEDCYVNLSSVSPSPEAVNLAQQTGKDPRLVELILRESVAVVRYRPGVIIVEHRLGMVHANAGIDQSNIEDNDRVLLLPEDPDASAAGMRARLMQHYHIELAVIVNDSAGRAWRNGITGYAIGCAGITPLLDLRGSPDLFGRPLRVTQVAVADELAAAASIMMGQGNEAVPAVIIRGARAERSDDTAGVLLRDPAEDMFRDW
jgi:coenzyme F420-0:L-glutamate ligase/coenzyme F420-1:gamma-L-glutamate ligase